MSAELNPYAGFDCLSVLGRLGERHGGITYAEIHLFCYLACLLALYRERPAADWGYTFAGTQQGAPFSREVDAAVRTYSSLGLISRMTVTTSVLTPAGIDELEQLRTLASNRARDEFIEAACSCASAMPISIIQNALGQEPELRRVRRLRATSRLLEEAGLLQLYEHFQALGQVVGTEVADLLVPAHVWLTYLSRASSRSQRRGDRR